jgi:hypothetical protein
MKALSLRQPWAALVVTGKKSIEIRTWKPRKLRLPQSILVHASKKVDDEMLDAFGMPVDLPKGAILGEVLMTEVVQYNTRDEWLDDLKKHCDGPDGFRQGLYGFVLERPTEYVEPIPCKGRLSFFDVDPRALECRDKGGTQSKVGENHFSS